MSKHTQEREAFEKAMEPLGLVDMWLETDDAGNYTFSRAMDAWEGWRARDAIAADLLTALNAMLTYFGMDEDEWSRPVFDKARAAIAKATGEQQ